jgi:hypothetical protein
LFRKAFGTGNTYGIIAWLEVENPGHDTLRIVLDPVVIPGKKHFQNYVVPFATPVTIQPLSTKRIALYGYCLDPNLSACPENKTLTNPSKWYWVNVVQLSSSQDTGITKFLTAPCIPEQDNPFPVIYPGWKEASESVVAFSALLHKLAISDLYLPEGIPIAEVVQHCVWMVVQPLIGSEYNQEQAIDYWKRLANYDTITIRSPIFLLGTERVWQSALLLKNQYLCPAKVNEFYTVQLWNPQMFAIFTQTRIPVNEDQKTGIFPKVPSVPFIPPQPPLPPEEENGCQPVIRMEGLPLMNGGLNPKSAGIFLLRHQQLLPLTAEGADADIINFSCLPDANCPESPSLRREGLTSRVRFRWEHLDGPGHFTHDGTDTLLSSYEKAVLWCPPDLYGTITAKDTSVTSLLRLTIFDDLPGQPEDLPVIREITITTSLDTTIGFDSLNIKVEGYTFESYKQPEPSLVPGKCLAEPLRWSREKDLVPPLVSDESPLLRSGQRIVLDAVNIRDPDDLLLDCSSLCKHPSFQTVLEDEVIYTWRLIGDGNGYFLPGHNAKVKHTSGQEVIYEAPVMKNNELRKEILIEVRAYNQNGYQGLYERSPILVKKDDEMAIDTLHLRVDCNPNPNQAPTLVVIHWQDEFKDHDDPDHVEILKNISYTIPVYITADDCEPLPDQEVIEKEMAENSYKINPKVQDHKPQQDDMWDGYTFAVRMGSYLFIVDFGLMVDQGFHDPPTQKEKSELKELTIKTLKSLTKVSVMRGILSVRKDEISNRGMDLYNLLTDLILSIILKGQLPTDSPYFNDILTYFMQQNPGMTKEEAMEQMRKELVGENKGWENNETVKKFELGMMYSLWIVVSHPTRCLQSCPVTLDHFTCSSLGDTDHYYKRTSTIQVVRWEYNQPHIHTYRSIHEKKGPDFD